MAKSDSSLTRYKSGCQGERKCSCGEMSLGEEAESMIGKEIENGRHDVSRSTESCLT
jgi:hypothetical protein